MPINVAAKANHLLLSYRARLARRFGKEDVEMAKIVTCRDVGVDCDFVAKGDNEQEILQKCAEHARTAHGMSELPADLATKVRGAIHDEAA